MSIFAGQVGGRRRGFVLAIAALLAGCAQYQAAPIDPKRNVDDFAALRLTEGHVREKLSQVMPQSVTAWPPAEWDRAELLAVALTQNPQLAVARAEVQAVLSREVAAAEIPNPDMTLESEYARHDPHPWLYGVSLNWLLRPPERRKLEIEIARTETGNARLQLMDQAWAVRSALAAALSEWEGGRRRLLVLERLAAAEDRLGALEARRVEAGEDSPIELVNRQQARIDIDRQQAELREQLNAAQTAAARALGLPPQALDGVAFAWPDWGEPPPVGEEARRAAREQALLSRTDLGAAIGEYSAAETKLKLSVARQYPQFELSPGYYWDHGIAKFPFDVGFTLPLNRNKGEIAEARAMRELAGRRMLALQSGIYGEIMAAERAERIARDGADAAQRQLQAARHQKTSADLGLKLGASDLSDQIGAEMMAVRAELELLQRRSELQSARNSLEDALHAPLSGPELSLADSMATLVSEAGS